MDQQRQRRSSNRKPANLVQVACWLHPGQQQSLRRLSAKTRIPQQSHLREAIDDLIAKYPAAGS
jgi:hypothetical protein